MRTAPWWLRVKGAVFADAQKLPTDFTVVSPPGMLRSLVRSCGTSPAPWICRLALQARREAIGRPFFC